MFRISLIAGAIILGIGGAVATNATTHKASSGSNLYWFNTSGTTFDALQDHAAEVLTSGCPDNGSNDCRYGYDISQLNDPTNPSLGVQPSEVASPMDVINKP